MDNITIEQLYEQLQAEITARKMLEDKLNSQSDGMSNIENRLGNQIQSAVTALESHIKSVEATANGEADIRAGADDSLRSAISGKDAIIAEEVGARTSADENIQEQIQSLSTVTSSLENSLNGCRTDIDTNSANIQSEVKTRTDEYNSLESTIQKTRAELTQNVSSLQTNFELLSDKAKTLEENSAANTEAIDSINTSIAANSTGIENNTQNISVIKNDLAQTKESILNEDAINALIDSAFSDRFTTQQQELQDTLAQEKASRDADIENIYDYAARAQNACEQSKAYLDSYQQSSQNAAKLMRDTFNLLLPKGTILPFAGDLYDIPDGWRLCNGANGTPDLVGKVLVGAPADSEEETEFSFGSEGGEKEARLDAGNLPAHYHLSGIAGSDNKGYFFVSGSGGNGKTFNFKDVPQHEQLWGAREWNGAGKNSFIHSAHMMEDDTGINMITSNQVSDGVAKAHNNMQPYRCVYYIMKMF